jgi:hypothetical protein
MKRTSKRPLLGITMGDPGGIGPEVCAKALADPEVLTVCRPMIVGDAAIMADAVSFSNLDLAVNACRKVTGRAIYPRVASTCWTWATCPWPTCAPNRHGRPGPGLFRVHRPCHCPGLGRGDRRYRHGADQQGRHQRRRDFIMPATPRSMVKKPGRPTMP